MNSLFKLIASSFLSAFLIGCIDIDQKINVVKDELIYKVDLIMDAQIAELSDKKPGQYCDFSFTKIDGLITEIKETKEGGNIICSFSAEGKLDKFSNFKLLTDKEKTPLVQISKIDGDKYRIENIVDMSKKDEKGKNPLEGMEALFAGRSLSWSVSASKIVETNGKIAENGQSVAWKVPLATAIKSPQKIFVVFEKESSWIDKIINFFKKIFQSIIGLFNSNSTPQNSNSPTKPEQSLVPVGASSESTSNSPSKSEQSPASTQAPNQSNSSIEGKWSGWGGNTCENPLTFKEGKLALEGNDFDPVEVTKNSTHEFVVKSKSDPKDQGLVLSNVTAASMKITSNASGDDFVLARCQ